MAPYEGGRPPAVTVTAVPFWELASGHFQDLAVRMHSVTVNGLDIAAVQLHWFDGGLNLAALAKGRVVVTRPGRFMMTVELTNHNLSSLLLREKAFTDPTVTVTSGGIDVQGSLTLGHEVVPLNAVGAITESPNHEALFYHPERIDGLRLPLLTNVQLLNLDSVTLPLPLYIQRVALTPGQLVLTMANHEGQ
jgi:hypothetical protein